MIEIRHISKAFGSNTVFEDYSLDIPDGSFVVFAGKSGCGKTTLLNMIGGLEKPDSGEILVDGLDIHKKRNMTDYFTYKVGFLFQNFALAEDMTVYKNLQLVQKKARTERSIEDILDELGIPDKKDEAVYKLSGGEQQRVALARLMYKKCDIILADEPTGSLDSENAATVLTILHRLNDSGKTVIVVTHNEMIVKSEQWVINL